MEFEDFDLWDFEENYTTSINDTECETPTATLPTALDITLRSLHVIYSAALLVCSFALNSFVIFLVVKHKTLRNLSMALATQVIVVDLLSALAILPSSIANASANRWLFGDIVCFIQGAVIFTLLYERSGLMFMLVIDRFLLIYKTYSYPKHRAKVVVALSIFSWLVGIIAAIIMFPGIINCYAFSRPQWTCISLSSCKTACSVIVLLIFIITLILCCISAFLYTLLFCKARKMSNTTPACDLSGDDDTRKREWKATITFFLMFVTLFIVTVPFGSFLIIGHLAFKLSGSEIAVWYEVIRLCSFELTRLVYVLDPIFIMRNRDIKEVISKLFTSSC